MRPQMLAIFYWAFNIFTLSMWIWLPFSLKIQFSFTWIPHSFWRQVSQAFRAQGQRNTDVCIPKLCLWKDWCLPGDPLKLQLQERVFFFVPHSESQRGHPEGRWGPTVPGLSAPWEHVKTRTCRTGHILIYTQCRRRQLLNLILTCF